MLHVDKTHDVYLCIVPINASLGGEKRENFAKAVDRW